jgi:predicted CXXCH cytochrome family protein
MSLRRTQIATGLTAVMMLAIVTAGLPSRHRTEKEVPAIDASFATISASRYVDNAQCLGCHTEQAQQWQTSHHAMAMALPTPQSVRGDFDNTTFTHQGQTSRFFTRDEQYVVYTDGPDGKLADFPIAYTFGVAPLQQYLIAMPGGRLQPLQIAWDSDRKRWFHLLPDEKTPPDDVLHWTGRYQTANTMCLTCHTTGYEKRYDAATDSFASRWHEPGVSCQACHGPGERHLRWADLHAKEKKADDLPGEHRGFAQVLQSGAAGQIDVCAGCHSRRTELTPTFLPGRERLDQHVPVLLTAGLYHADGQQLDEVFVDGSFRQSKMHRMGVGCTNCHNAHTGKTRFEGNALCTQCHTAQANKEFPTAAGNFDAPEHHFHSAGSPGAQCVACHMPAKTYMQIQARPDHSLRVARPDLSVKLGTPNACNGCHTDKPAQWAADRVAAWYGKQRRQEAHYGEIFAAANAGRPEAGEALIRLVADAQQSAIVRATALNSLRAYGDAGLSVRLEATRDPDPEVRAAAADSYEAIAASQRLYALTPLLRDRILAVRIAAARSLSSLPPEQIDARTRPLFDAALTEFIAAQQHSLDMPGPRLNLAVVYENTGQHDLAEKHYLAALKIDPDFTPARANLSRLYNATGRNADAELVLKTGLNRQPAIGELQYSLGLLLAEENRLPEAAEALYKAATLMPDNYRVRYNLGLTLQHIGRVEAAAAALREAHRLNERDPAPLQALAILYAQAGQRDVALRWAEKFAAANPGDTQAQQFVDYLRAGH